MKKHYSKLPAFLKLNAFYRSSLGTEGYDDLTTDLDEKVRVHPYDANLISSEKSNDEHVLFLDLDQEHWYGPSSTPGHAHLAINANLSLEALKEVVAVLTKWGLLQAGIQKQLEQNNALFLRMPGMSKTIPADNMSLEEAKAYYAKEKGLNKLEQVVAPFLHQGGPVTDPFLPQKEILDFVGLGLGIDWMQHAVDHLIAIGIIDGGKGVTIYQELMPAGHYRTRMHSGDNVVADIVGKSLVFKSEFYPGIWNQVRQLLRTNSQYAIFKTWGNMSEYFKGVPIEVEFNFKNQVIAVTEMHEYGVNKTAYTVEFVQSLVTAEQWKQIEKMSKPFKEQK